MRSLLAAASAAALVSTACGGEVTVGDVRVQALSPTLVRLEPKGPMGFENRTTFVVVGRDFDGIPIKVASQSAGSATLTTDYYDVEVTQAATSNDTCGNVMKGTDVNNPTRTYTYENGAKAADRAACCAMCSADDTCSAFVFAGDSQPLGDGIRDVPGANCWPLAGYSSTRSARNREVGCVRGCSPITSVKVTSKNGTVLYSLDHESASNLLHWPSPLASKSYAFTDYPRFFVPEWGPQPIPAGSKVDPALVGTNGYDFRNNVGGDMYVFLLGDDLAGWEASRKEFIHLTGPTPLLPDFSWGTWFTYWHSYTEAEAKDDIGHWENLSLPIDVWALDMNWRQTANDMDHFYNYPNTQLFPDFANNSTAWFDYLAAHKLRTYFNDHPYPVNDQTTPQEIAFRWAGLTSWMAKGLTYWWFDHNWKFSIPPPFVRVPGNKTSGNWEGLSNAVWGSHIYHATVERYDKVFRPASFPRAITLTKFAIPDWRPGYSPSQADENPAHHRFPVWWTGDGVNLQASLQSMVDQGVHAFKPYVHSDCGGDYRGKEGSDLVRWVAHCSMGTILRLHGNDHRPWTYDGATVDAVRNYLNMRYQLIPSLITAGQDVTSTGFPLAARCDLYWPEHSEARSNEQYIHLKDTLVAPFWDTSKTRSVWVPPGQWQDAWSGETVTGPKTMTVQQNGTQIPMWHRRGGLVITTSKPGLRVDEQDWSELTLEAFPSTEAATVNRSVYARDTGARTDVQMRTGGNNVVVDISASEERAWVLRLHLTPGQHVQTATVDGQAVSTLILAPLDTVAAAHFPFRGAGSSPAALAGSVVEVRAPASGAARNIVVSLA